MCIILEPCTEAGQQPNDKNTACELCPMNTAKTAEEATANWKSKCTPCGDGEETVEEGSTDPNMCFSKSRL